MKSYRTISAALRQKVFEKYDHSCAVCGVNNDLIPLELAHLVPIIHGGESSEDNLTLLCPNCHQTFDRKPQEIEFVSFLTELLRLHSDFNEVQQEAILGGKIRYQADILVNRRTANVKEVLLIECKTYPVLATAHLQNIIAQLKNYKDSFGECRMVLAIPSTLREREIEALTAAGVEAWDLRYMASHFSKQIHEASPSYFKALFLTQIARPKKKPTREEQLLRSLASCIPGKPDWHVYQTLVGEILECLFTPPLGKPIPELSDKSASNRRDFIMPNYAEIGFWSFLRQKYEADYIVIDAKNYTRKVKKPEVLQIANYLKAHGAGLFGLIFSRDGGDSFGCEHTLREQWLVHRKMILVLNDEEVNAMLVAKSDGKAPEDILGQKIESFRLSM